MRSKSLRVFAWPSVAVITCLLGCAPAMPHMGRAPASSRAVPAYFLVMQRGTGLERRGDRRGAVACYREAESLTGGVDPSLRRPALVAVHNRLAACYARDGDLASALTEFRLSLHLGDHTYAPKAIAHLTRRLPAAKRHGRDRSNVLAQTAG